MSPHQQEALDQAKAAGGKLVRWPGGFWTVPGCSVQRHVKDPVWGDHDVPTWWARTATVKALIRSGAVRVTEEARPGFAVAVEVAS